MKRFIALLFVITMSFSTVEQQRAEAAAGLVTGNAIVAITGAIIIYPGAHLAFYHYAENENLVAAFMMYVLVGAFGIGVLDADPSGNLTFNTIDENAAKQFGISETERNAFNNHLEELELINAEVASQLNKNSTVEDAKALWSDYKELLPKDVFTTLQKLTAE